MINVLHIINKISPTSIPVTWARYQETVDGLSPLVTSVREITRLYKYVRECDIVHGHHIKYSLLAVLIAKILSKPFIFTTHGSFLHLSLTNKLLIMVIYRAANQVTFVNNELYQQLPGACKKIIENKTAVILNGVDINYSYKYSAVIENFGIPNNKSIIFHPSRHVHEKNQIRILEAIEISLRSNPNIVLVMAGSGPLEDALKNKAKALGIYEKVYFLGYISRNDVYNFLNCCSLYLMPSLSEGLNVSFLEALSQRARIVVSDIEQFTYPFRHWNVNPDDYQVTFCNPMDSNSISSAINSSLLNSTNERCWDLSFIDIKSMIDAYRTVYLRTLSAESHCRR